MAKQFLNIIFLLFIGFHSVGQLYPTKSLLTAHRSVLLNNLTSLVKDSVLYEQININPQTITISTEKDSAVLNHDFYSEIQHPTPFAPQGYGKPLTGLKVAIDPGHTAYSFESAQIEGKFVSLTKGESTCEIYESKSTWLVAITLKNLLENQGAEVLMTRNQIEKDSKGTDFPYWLKNRAKTEIDSLLNNELINPDRHVYLSKCLADISSRANKKALFKYAYNIIDIENRALIINKFEPHLTIIIHFNVDVNNLGWSQPTLQNYNMVFTPGAFMEGEIENTEDAKLFSDLLFSSRVKKSNDLGRLVLKNLNKELEMSPLINDDDIEYLKEYSLKSPFNGVYSRNLSLTRKIKSTLCYGETIYQDHWESCIDLAKENIEFEGYFINQTIYKIATGYFKGIKEYLEYEFE